MYRVLSFDKMILTATLVLVALGVLMIYSSSAIRAQDRFGDSSFFLKRQLLWAGLGVLAMVWMMNWDYRGWQRLALPLFLLSLLLLILVLIPSVGVRVNGARRWLSLFGLSFQPAELAKISLILFLSHLLAKKGPAVQEFAQGFLPLMVATGIMALPVLLQPHLGNVMVMWAVAMMICFVGGARIFHLLWLWLGSLPLLLLLMMQFSHARSRVFALLDPSRVPEGARYQIKQSFYALGPGGFLGRGLGDGIQKLFYLPEPHTDFIFAILGEEMGFIGTSVVVLLFGILLWRGTRVALRAPDPFSRYTAMGITCLIVSQAAINLGMVIGLLPTTGLPLPFISFGGSCLVLSLMEIGILLNISHYSGSGVR
ncbi:MAG: putative lipid II flippase FtsW [candidate division NC10 bacterium]|nr:putative lipid II flippase FtsW [candidate division NC10 bacterium]